MFSVLHVFTLHFSHVFSPCSQACDESQAELSPGYSFPLGEAAKHQLFGLVSVPAHGQLCKLVTYHDTLPARGSHGGSHHISIVEKEEHNFSAQHMIHIHTQPQGSGKDHDKRWKKPLEFLTERGRHFPLG